ncbi:MAG: pentapeptide repeat-containing protein [Nitrospiria bacterium]
MSVPSLKIIRFVLLLLVSLLLTPRNPVLFAEEGKTPLSKSALLSKIQKGETLRGYLIQGADLIEGIQKIDNTIEIEDSVIQSGLDFEKLPLVALKIDDLPETWSTKKKRRFLGEIGGRPLRVIRNRISIFLTTIEQNPKGSEAISAPETVFFQPVFFLKTTFDGHSSFDQAVFADTSRFDESQFIENAAFDEAFFFEKTRFQKTRFHEDSGFREARFFGESSFVSSAFEAYADFGKTIFEESTDFRWTTFNGPLNLSQSTFNNVSDFREAKFEETADLSGTAFHEKADFRTALFHSSANFNRAALHESIHFQGTVFKNRLSLRAAKITGFVDFRDAIIGQLDFFNRENPLLVPGRLDFRKAIISDAHFEDIVFEREIHFSDAIFMNAVFRNISFENNTYFLRAKLRLQTDFDTVRFKQDADFTAADLRTNQKFSLSYVNFNNLILNWNQLPSLKAWANNSEDQVKSFLDIEAENQERLNGEKEARAKIGGTEPLSKVLTGLESHFRAHSQLDDANEAHFHAQDIAFKRKREVTANTSLFSKQGLWMAWHIIWRTTTGFGMRITWILGWCLGLNLVFTLIYFFQGRLTAAQNPDEAFRLRLFDFPAKYYTGTTQETQRDAIARFFNIFWFSAVVLMKIGPRKKLLSGHIVGMDYKYVIRVEWLIGYYFLAALSITLSNTVPIVNRLVTGIF